MKPLNIIILAAGKGTRMHSNIPKVLHEVGGKTILAHVIECAKALNPNKIIVVYGFGGEIVKNNNIFTKILELMRKVRANESSTTGN